MKRASAALLACFFAVTLAGLCAVSSPVSADEPRPLALRGDQKILALADSLAGALPARMAGAGIPGLSMAIVDRDGIVWAKGFGVRSTGGTDPVTTETLFSLQSISKVVTATAIMIAVQDGTLDLDAPVSAYLPKFTVHSRFEKKPQDLMTLRHFLTHRSGLVHEAPVGSNFTRGAVTFEDHIRSIGETWTLFPVGSRYKYSNLGMDLAGYALQTASGMPFEKYVEKRLLEPLGMSASTFDAARIMANPNRATGAPPGGAELVFEHGMIPCGGMYASAVDMAAFVRFLLNRGMAGSKRILDERFVDAMTGEPFFFQGQLYGHGLGVFKANRLAGRTLRNPFPMHSGGGFGFGANISWLPEYGVGVVVLTNSSNSDFAAGLAHAALGTILATMGATPETWTPWADLSETTVSRDLLAPLFGTYVQRQDWVEFGEKDGVPVFTLRDGRSFAAHFVSEREAYVDIPNTAYRTLFRFVVGADGAPACLYTVHDADRYAYAGGPNDPTGPDKPEWEKYVGSYEWLAGGTPVLTTRIQRKNGWLYLEHMKLVEQEPGLFFLPDGEYVDLRSATPVGGGIAGRKKI